MTNLTQGNPILFHNATFWLGDQVCPTAGWMEISENTISKLAAGALPESLKTDRAIDLNHAHVLPGFVDCHSHLTVSAWIPWSMEGSHWQSKTDILDALSCQAQITPKDNWLIAFHANFRRMGRLPTSDELQEASEGRPVLINDFSLHQCLANETAMAKANITRLNFPSDYIKCRKGKPTGLLKEAASGHMLSIGLTEFAQQLESFSLLSLLEAEANRHLALGITACHDPCVHPKMQSAMEKLEQRSPLRLSWSHVKSNEQADYVAEDLCLACGTGPKSAKIFLDGAHECAICIHPLQAMQVSAYAIARALKGKLTGLRILAETRMRYQNGQLYTPYLQLDQNALSRSLETIGHQGLRPKIHALGNDAVKCACSALMQSETTDSTIEHLTFLSEDNLDDIAAAGAVASLQPGFLDQADQITATGLDKVMKVIPAQSLLRAGVPIALSSDNPCGPLDPLGNIRCAVKRHSANGRLIDIKEKISYSEAIRAYSIGGHHAIHGKPGRGLSEGELADFVIVNGHPENPNAQVISTWIDGKEVYCRGPKWMK